MSPKKRVVTRQSEPKIFQCTGYGDCSMIFSRSEHLARHARKHTGEKPYKCIVANCSRTFSRIDNMMQHTQTHSRNSKKKTSDVNHTMSSPVDDLLPFVQEHPIPNLYQPYPSPHASPFSESKMDLPVQKPLFQKLGNIRYINLSTPIQWLAHHEQDMPSEETIAITADEYHALQGFGQFCTAPRVIVKPLLHLAQKSFQPSIFN